MSDSLLQILEVLNEVLDEELLARNWQGMFDEPETVETPTDKFAQDIYNILKPESKPTQLLTSEDFATLNAELDSEDEEVGDNAFEKVKQLANLLQQGLVNGIKMKKDLVVAISQQESLLDALKSIGFDISKLEDLLPTDESEPEAETLEPAVRTSITSPNIIKDAGSLAAITKNVIGATASNPETLMKALKEIAEFSKSAGENINIFGESGYNSKNASKVILLDYINEMVASQETSGYQFEYLMAGISGGKQMGITKTESGKMGAVDFEMQDGHKGSCKLYSTFGNISQAVNGFEVDQPVFYTVGIKQKGDTGSYLSIDLWTMTIEKKSDLIKITSPEQVNSIKQQLDALQNPYSKLEIDEAGLKIRDKKGDKRVVGYYEFTLNGKTFPVLAFEGEPTSIPINKKPVRATGSQKFEFSFAVNDTTVARRQMSNSYEQQTKLVIDTLTKIVDNLAKTKKKTQDYFSSGDANDGLDAFSAVYSTEENLKSLASTVSGEGAGELLQKKAKKS